MKCGLYELDITPSLGNEMPGQFFIRISDGIKEKLYVHAMYMCNDKDEKVVIISVDTVCIIEEIGEEVRDNIAKALDMKKECVMLSATHIHTGGPVTTWRDFSHQNFAYTDFLKKRIVDAAVLAAKEVRDVTIGYSKGIEDRISFYRDFVFEDGHYRTNPGMLPNKKPFGDIDPEVGVLRIDNMDSSPYGAIVNFSCHCDCVGGTEYSSDYPGAMKDTLKKVYGKSFVPIFINAFSGNINHNDFENAFNKEIPNHYRRMGRMLASVVIRTREISDSMKNESLCGIQEYIQIPTREPDAELLAWADATLKDTDVSPREEFYALEAKRMDETGVEQIKTVLQVIKIGDLAIFALPAEVYVEFGRYLKKHSPSKYVMTANLANSAVGYVPIKELFQPGIYEAMLCVSSQLIEEAGYIMNDKLLELSKKLW